MSSFIQLFSISIHRYAVIPLSTNSGLIGWVPHCDTLHTLIRDYRDKKKILLNIEHRIMLRMAPDYEHLTLMQKVEVFEHALANTHGDDLAKVLWLKSPSSEVSDQTCVYLCTQPFSHKFIDIVLWLEYFNFSSWRELEIHVYKIYRKLKIEQDHCDNSTCIY